MWPDIVGFYDMLYGTAGVDLQALTVFQFGNASGIVFPGNPPYYVTYFLNIYPKFFGQASSFTSLVLTANSNAVTGFTGVNIQGIAPGQLVVNSNSVPLDTVVTGVNPTTGTVMLSNPVSQNDTSLTIYEAPFVPLVVMLMYVFLARISVSQQRYFGMWPQMMALFIAHYCTMYLRSESGPNNTAAQVASSGLERGLIAAKSAGGVSAGIRFVDGYEAWGAFQETTYGVQFITIARAVNAGPVYII